MPGLLEFAHARVYNHINMIEKRESYIVTGPTASGKSEYAHKLARKINGVIINCDSVQIYGGIENISASPFAGRDITPEIDGVPYRLFSILPLSVQISVAKYLDMARREYDAARNAGKTPIFVGGTGYYINALINGMSPVPEISDKNRAQAREMVAPTRRTRNRSVFANRDTFNRMAKVAARRRNLPHPI